MPFGTCLIGCRRIPLLYVPGTWGSESGSLSMAPAGKGPVWSWSSALLTFWLGPPCARSLENTCVRSHRHTTRRPRVHRRTCARSQSGEYARSVPLFSPLPSSSMVGCPRVPPGHGRVPAMECAHSGGPEEMAPVFATHPTGTWVHCDKGHESCGLPTNRYPTRVPPRTSPWLLGRTSGPRLCRPQSRGQEPWE